MVKEGQILLVLVATKVAVYAGSTSETFVQTNALRVVFTGVVGRKK
jgi:hypothetical protein